MRAVAHQVTSVDGRALRVYDTGDAADGHEVTVIWHHGTPHIGQPPVPLATEFRARGIRCVSYDRPGYGGSSRSHGRNVAAVAADVLAIANTLEIDTFATVGISSGAPHALACAVLLPDRVSCVVSMAGPAPFGVGGLDWFAGMADAVATRMRIGAEGTAAIERHLRTVGFAPGGLTTSDLAALIGDWRWLSEISERAMADGLPGVVDDVRSMVIPWGFRPADITAPVLLVHGDADRVIPSSHGRWLAGQVRTARLWLRPKDGHITVLGSCAAALDWLVTHSS